jgi:hypothetical protein
MHKLLLLTCVFSTVIEQFDKANASIIHSRTEAPSAEKITGVTQRSYEEKLRLKREELNALRSQNAPQEQIKTVEDEITALTKTIENIRSQTAKTSMMFAPKENPLQGQHVGLARMPQYNAVGILESSEHNSCSATIINETSDQKYWIGITAAHCVGSSNPAQSGAPLVSGLSFCFKPLSSFIEGERESDVCNDADWIPAVAATAHADYFAEHEGNPLRDMAFFLIPKTTKRVNYPLLPTEEERQKLYQKISENGLEVIGVGYGKAGHIIDELQEQFNKKRSAAGTVSLSDFIELEDMGQGLRRGEINFFKSAYRISIYSKKGAKKLLDIPTSHFSSDLLEIPHPIRWENGKIISEDSNIFSGSGRSGDSGRALFTKNNEGKNMVISVASVGQGFIVITPKNNPRNKEFFWGFSEIPQNISGLCDTGEATCAIYFAGADSSLLDPVMHKWALNEVSLLKAGLEAFAASKQNDRSSVFRIFTGQKQQSTFIPTLNSPSGNEHEEAQVEEGDFMEEEQLPPQSLGTNGEEIGDENYIQQSILQAQEDTSYLTHQGDYEVISQIQQMISEMEQQIKEIKSIYTAGTPDPTIMIQKLLIPQTTVPSEFLNINGLIGKINGLLQKEASHTPSLKDKTLPLLPTTSSIPASLIGSLQHLQNELETLPAYFSGNFKGTGDLQADLEYFNGNISYLNEMLGYIGGTDENTKEVLDTYRQNLTSLHDYLESMKRP